MPATTSPELFTGSFPVDLAVIAADRELIARDLGQRYEISGYIDRGGFATVWKAIDRVTGTPVAVKRLDPRAGRGSDFYRELRAMFALDHPHVVRIINLQESSGFRYLILEYCAGGNLRAVLSRARRNKNQCSAPWVSAVVSALAEALTAAHRQGLAHRDLKPENVLFAGTFSTPFPRPTSVKLADFGLARLLARPENGVLHGLTGSPAYMAPEQFSGVITPASDIYSLGVMVYELLTGDLPFTGGPEQLAYHHINTPLDIPDDLSTEWHDRLSAMLAKNPECRPSASQIRDRLQNDAPTSSPRDSSGVTLDITPKSESPRFQRLGPVQSIHAHPTLGKEFVAVASGELIRLNADGLSQMLTELGERWTLVTGSNESIYAVEGQQVLRFDTGGSWILMGRVPFGLVAPQPFEANDGFRCVGYRNGFVECHDLTRQQLCWSQPVATAGLRPAICCSITGRVITVTDFTDTPGIRFFEADGKPLGRVSLPGICWRLGPWPESDEFYVRVLTGHGFEGYRVSSKLVHRLKGSRGVTDIVADSRANHVIGLWADGTMMSWSSPNPVRLKSVPGHGCRYLAASASQLAVVLDHGGPAVWIGQVER